MRKCNCITMHCHDENRIEEENWSPGKFTSLEKLKIEIRKQRKYEYEYEYEYGYGYGYEYEYEYIPYSIDIHNPHVI